MARGCQAHHQARRSSRPPLELGGSAGAARNDGVQGVVGGGVVGGVEGGAGGGVEGGVDVQTFF